jgi:hypothetical protein
MSSESVKLSEADLVFKPCEDDSKIVRVPISKM